MKVLSKKELAQKLNISQSTLYRWLQDHMTELKARGYKKNQRLFKPCQLEYLKSELGTWEE